QLRGIDAARAGTDRSHQLHDIQPASRRLHIHRLDQRAQRAPASDTDRMRATEPASSFAGGEIPDRTPKVFVGTRQVPDNDDMVKIKSGFQPLLQFAMTRIVLVHGDSYDASVPRLGDQP